MAVNIGMNINISQQQKLTMTPKLQQSIGMLQMTIPELAELIKNELSENPVLEIDEKNKETKSDGENELRDSEYEEENSSLEKNEDINWEDYFDSTELWDRTTPNFKEGKDEFNYENFVSKNITLHEHLLLQLKINTFNLSDYKIGEFLIGNIDSSGYLKISIEDSMKYLKKSREDIEEILYLIQNFDPTGVGARNLKESLLVQYRNMDDYRKGDIIERVIENHLELLADKNFKKIAELENSTPDEIQEVMDYITEFLNPKPGLKYPSTDDNSYIKPDVIVEKIDGEYVVSLNDSELPKLVINKKYKRILQNRTKGEKDLKDTKNYVKDKLNAAKWLIESIIQRRETILKVAKSIVKFQKDFFDFGISHFKPLTLKDVSIDVGIHESTASRVTTNKFMQTPSGVFEFKYFFSSSISSTGGAGDVSSVMVKNKIKTLIENENPKKPLSDQKIVNLLKEEGIEIARRTVSKYREEMNILSSSKRKRL